MNLDPFPVGAPVLYTRSTGETVRGRYGGINNDGTYRYEYDTGVGEVSGHSALKKWQKKVASGLLHHQAKVWSRHLGTMLREERQGLPEA